MTSPCRAIAPLVQSYLDGELDPSQLAQVETHTQTCATCRERIVLDRAIRSGVRASVARSKPTAAFRGRAAASVVAQRWSPSEKSPATVPTWGGWIVAAAAAAAAVLGIQGQFQTSAGPAADTSPRPMDATNKASLGLDQMIDQFVDWHARPLPPEVTNPKDLPGFEPYVGVPVHPPALSPFGAHLLGGRILPIPEHRVAAMLQYTMDGGHRVSVYVFDPRRIETKPSHLRAKVIGSDSVYIANVRGWSVAAIEPPRKGIGYAIASDLGDEENAELALTAARSGLEAP
jgi:anti-sigma factor RsiW